MVVMQPVEDRHHLDPLRQQLGHHRRVRLDARGVRGASLAAPSVVITVSAVWQRRLRLQVPGLAPPGRGTSAPSSATARGHGRSPARSPPAAADRPDPAGNACAAAPPFPSSLLLAGNDRQTPRSVVHAWRHWVVYTARRRVVHTPRLTPGPHDPAVPGHSRAATDRSVTDGSCWTPGSRRRTTGTPRRGPWSLGGVDGRVCERGRRHSTARRTVIPNGPAGGDPTRHWHRVHRDGTHTAHSSSGRPMSDLALSGYSHRSRCSQCLGYSHWSR